jgi:TRAP-type mannitol/chloroaromatic compound transport system permease small subunit
MKAIKTLSRWIDTVNEWIGRGVAWVTLGLVLVVFIDVVMRYLFNTSFVFTQELEWHLFGFIFLIGAGYTLLHDGHVRVDIFYQRLSHKGRAWVNFLGVLLFLIPGCIMVISTSWKFMVNSFSILEGSPDPGGIPLRFLIKGCIPAGFVLLLMQGISLGIHSLQQILGIEESEEEKV